MGGIVQLGGPVVPRHERPVFLQHPRPVGGIVRNSVGIDLRGVQVPGHAGIARIGLGQQLPVLGAAVPPHRHIGENRPHRGNSGNNESDDGAGGEVPGTIDQFGRFFDSGDGSFSPVGLGEQFIGFAPDVLLLVEGYLAVLAKVRAGPPARGIQGKDEQAVSPLLTVFAQPLRMLVPCEPQHFRVEDCPVLIVRRSVVRVDGNRGGFPELDALQRGHKCIGVQNSCRVFHDDLVRGDGSGSAGTPGERDQDQQQSG